MSYTEFCDKWKRRPPLPPPTHTTHRITNIAPMLVHTNGLFVHVRGAVVYERGGGGGLPSRLSKYAGWYFRVYALGAGGGGCGGGTVDAREP